MAHEENYSLAVLKPDFLELNLFQELISLTKERGLKIIGKSTICMDIDFVKKLYQWEEINYLREIKDYLCSVRMPIWIFHGNDAILKMLAIKKALRDAYSRDELHTLIHCPDTDEDFEREYQLLNSKKGEAMKTNNQIEVIVFSRDEHGDVRYLMLKRNARKGNFWQPITGNVELGESFEQAAERELMEETGIIGCVRIFDTGYSFDFFDDNRNQHEKVYAAEVSPGTQVVLSEEHTEFAWAKEDDCISNYLKYPGNIAGLKALAQVLGGENA